MWDCGGHLRCGRNVQGYNILFSISLLIGIVVDRVEEGDGDGRLATHMDNTVKFRRRIVRSVRLELLAARSCCGDDH